MLFKNRTEAGQLLAKKLDAYSGKKDVVVMGLARGGVIVAFALSQELKADLDVIVVRKVGAPNNEELALGAITDEGKGVFNDELIALLGVSNQYLRKETEKQKEIASQRKKRYLEGREVKGVEGNVVILVDDGIATGASIKVAIEAVRIKHPEKIVLAIPVAPKDSLSEIAQLVDEAVCLSTPSNFQAVGAFYDDFPQVSDEEIVDLLSRSK